MVKVEYDFWILVTCLLILALQIHNPFQSTRPSACQCHGDSAPAAGAAAGNMPGPSEAAAAAAAVGAASGAAAAPRRHPSATQPARPPEPPRSAARPAYRPVQAAPPAAAGPVGLSTDALLRELDAIQGKAKEQQETLQAAGRMPPPSPILQQLRETDAVAEGTRPRLAAARPPPGAPPGVPPGVPLPPSPRSASPLPAMQVPPVAPLSAAAAAAAGVQPPAAAAVASGELLLRRRDDLGRFLQARQPRGLGVVLGVGRGAFALRLLADWQSALGVYLIDPFIHIWRGYNDPANVPDRDQQLLFEDLRNQLRPYEGRYVLVRDFSHSFAEAYKTGGQTPGSPTFVYVDANHAEEAVTRDIKLWWPLLAPGGMLAGSTYADGGTVGVQRAVDAFARLRGLQVYLTHDDSPPSWFVFKP